MIFPLITTVDDDVIASFNWHPRGMQIEKRIETEIDCDILLPKWYKNKVFGS